jgi:hypothetical protein
MVPKALHTRYIHGFLTWELFYPPSDSDLPADFFLALGCYFRALKREDIMNPKLEQIQMNVTEY